MIKTLLKTLTSKRPMALLLSLVLLFGTMGGTNFAFAADADTSGSAMTISVGNEDVGGTIKDIDISKTQTMAYNMNLKGAVEKVVTIELPKELSFSATQSYPTGSTPKITAATADKGAVLSLSLGLATGVSTFSVNLSVNGGAVHSLTAMEVKSTLIVGGNVAGEPIVKTFVVPNYQAIEAVSNYSNFFGVEPVTVTPNTVLSFKTVLSTTWAINKIYPGNFLVKDLTLKTDLKELIKVIDVGSSVYRAITTDELKALDFKFADTNFVIDENFILTGTNKNTTTLNGTTAIVAKFTATFPIDVFPTGTIIQSKSNATTPAPADSDVFKLTGKENGFDGFPVNYYCYPSTLTVGTDPAGPASLKAWPAKMSVYSSLNDVLNLSSIEQGLAQIYFEVGAKDLTDVSMNISMPNDFIITGFREGEYAWTGLLKEFFPITISGNDIEGNPSSTTISYDQAKDFKLVTLTKPIIGNAKINFTKLNKMTLYSVGSNYMYLNGHWKADKTNGEKYDITIDKNITATYEGADGQQVAGGTILLTNTNNKSTFAIADKTSTSMYATSDLNTITTSTTKELSVKPNEEFTLIAGIRRGEMNRAQRQTVNDPVVYFSLPKEIVSPRGNYEFKIEDIAFPKGSIDTEDFKFADDAQISVLAGSNGYNTAATADSTGGYVVRVSMPGLKITSDVTYSYIALTVKPNDSFTKNTTFSLSNLTVRAGTTDTTSNHVRNYDGYEIAGTGIVDLELAGPTGGKDSDKTLTRSIKMQLDVVPVQEATGITGIIAKSGEAAKSYNPKDPASIPEMIPGTSGWFNMRMSNLTQSPVTGAVMYFVLPIGQGWKTIPNGTIALSPNSQTPTNVFYSTAAIKANFEDVNNPTVPDADNWVVTKTNPTADDYFLKDGETATGWTPYKGTENDEIMGRITAIKIVADLPAQTFYESRLPMKVPGILGGSTVSYGSKAIGRTLYNVGKVAGLSDDLIADVALTAAIKLKKSEVPTIVPKNAARIVEYWAGPAPTNDELFAATITDDINGDGKPLPALSVSKDFSTITLPDKTSMTFTAWETAGKTIDFKTKGVYKLNFLTTPDGDRLEGEATATVEVKGVSPVRLTSVVTLDAQGEIKDMAGYEEQTWKGTITFPADTTQLYNNDYPLQITVPTVNTLGAKAFNIKTDSFKLVGTDATFTIGADGKYTIHTLGKGLSGTKVNFEFKTNFTHSANSNYVNANATDATRTMSVSAILNGVATSKTEAKQVISIKDGIAPAITVGTSSITYKDSETKATDWVTAFNVSAKDGGGASTIVASGAPNVWTHNKTETITFTATDASGNSSTATATVTWLDTTQYTIDADGTYTIYVNGDNTQTFDEATFLAAINAKGLTGDGVPFEVAIVDASVVNASMITTGGSEYEVVLKPKTGDNDVRKTVLVSVVDNTAPVIQITKKTFNVEVGSSISADQLLDAARGGVSVTDNYTHNPDMKVAIGAGSYNAAVKGVYTITLNATDASGNPAAEKTLTVTVNDTAPPAFSTNTASATLEGGMEHSALELALADQGVTVSDKSGDTVSNTDATKKITLTSSPEIDYAKLGVAQTVTVTATDSAGNATSGSGNLTLTLKFVDTGVPKISTKYTHVDWTYANKTTFIESVYVEQFGIQVDDFINKTIVPTFTSDLPTDLIDVLYNKIYTITINATDGFNAAEKKTVTVLFTKTLEPGETAVPMWAQNLSAEAMTWNIDTEAPTADSIYNHYGLVIDYPGYTGNKTIVATDFVAPSTTTKDVVLGEKTFNFKGAAIPTSSLDLKPLTITYVDQTAPTMNVASGVTGGIGDYAYALDINSGKELADLKALITTAPTDNHTPDDKITWEITGVFDESQVGNYPVVVTAKDASGVTKTINVTIVVSDNDTPPTVTDNGGNAVTSATLTFEAGKYAQETAIDTLLADAGLTISDNNTNTTTFAPTATLPSLNTKGEVAVAVSIPDASGNVLEFTLNLDITDVTPPTLIVPTDVKELTYTANADYTDAGWANLMGASATDNATGDITFTVTTDVATPPSTLGTYTATITATDANDNTSASQTRDFKFVLNAGTTENPAPKISVNENFVDPADADQKVIFALGETMPDNAAFLTSIEAAAVYNEEDYGDEAFFVSSDIATVVGAEVGTYTVTLTLSTAGNDKIDTREIKVYVTDQTAPEFVEQDGIITAIEKGTKYTLETFLAFTKIKATDNNGTPTLTWDVNADGAEVTFSEDSKEVTVTATDDAKNYLGENNFLTNFITKMFTTSDNTAPILVSGKDGLANASFVEYFGETAVAIDSAKLIELFELTATDAPNATFEPVAADYTFAGLPDFFTPNVEYPITATVKDGAGNVSDEMPLKLTFKADNGDLVITYNNVVDENYAKIQSYSDPIVKEEDFVSEIVATVPGMATNGLKIVATYPQELADGKVGTHDVTLTLYDSEGFVVNLNKLSRDISQTTALYVITDLVPPVISAGNATETFANSTEVAAISELDFITQNGVTASDEYDSKQGKTSTTVTITDVHGSTDNSVSFAQMFDTVDVYTVTLSAKDVAGNEATTTVQVTITDEVAAVITAPATINYALGTTFADFDAFLADNAETIFATQAYDKSKEIEVKVLNTAAEFSSTWFNSAGEYTLTLDAKGTNLMEAIPVPVTIVVRDANAPSLTLGTPNLSYTTAQSLTETELYAAFDPTATDRDTTAPTIAMTGYTSNLFATVGTHTLTFTATNKSGLSSTARGTLTITSATIPEAKPDTIVDVPSTGGTTTPVITPTDTTGTTGTDTIAPTANQFVPNVTYTEPLAAEDIPQGLVQVPVTNAAGETEYMLVDEESALGALNIAKGDGLLGLKANPKTSDNSNSVPTTLMFTGLASLAFVIFLKKRKVN